MSNYNSHKVSVIGLGYVGCVTSVCLSYLRHKVIGVDIDNEKINMIKSAIPPIKEPLLGDYLKLSLKNNNLEATSDLDYAINNSDITFICVCTPPNPDGSCNLSYLIELINNIGQILKNKYHEHIIVLRSTIPPGTTEKLIIPALEEKSGKKNNRDFYLCYHPEFLREGTATQDFFNPPKYIIGENGNNHAGDKILELLLLSNHQQNIIRTSYKTAELVKYTDNVWHALKVAFANEIGTIANAYTIDSHELMDIFCMDKKLNISNYYLKPGLSYGGSCLPKDLQSMQYLVNDHNLDLPIINSIADSNNFNFDRTYEFIKKHAHGVIGWHGLSFKNNTDDLRNSINLELIAKISIDIQVNIYDNLINLESITNEKHLILDEKLENYKNIFIDDFIKLIDTSDTIVIGHDLAQYKNALLQYPKTLTIIDLTNNSIALNDTHHNYHGLFW